MELTVCSGGCLWQSSLLHQPSMYSPSIPLSSGTRNLQCASTTSESRPQAEQSGGRAKLTLQKRHSKSYLERQAAIDQVRRSSDLNSALSSVGDMLKVQDLNALLRQLGNLKRLQDLPQLFEWMRKSGKTNVSSYATYMKFMGKDLDAVKALEIFNSIQGETKYNVYVCNSVLRCLVRDGKFDCGVKLFDQMKRDGLTPDVVTYSTLLAGCIKVKHGFPKALKLIQDLQHCGLKMDSVLYGTLIAVCASDNKWEEAEHYFNQMKSEGHSPNVFHYSSLLNAYSISGNYKKGDELIKDMKSAGLVPNKVILTTLLKVYVRGGLFDKSRILLAELESLGYTNDEMPYCLLMDGLAKAGQTLAAKLIFNEMREKHVRSDGYAHSIMISAFCRGGLFEEAKQLARDFEVTFDRYDLVMLNTMLFAYCRAGEMESVMQTLKKMDELAISPDCNTFHILIKYFCNEKMYMLAYRTMEDMQCKGHQPEEELCSSLMSYLGKIGAQSEAFSVYNMLKYGKRTMCKALHEKILHILLSGQLLKDAYVVVKDNARFISQPAVKKFATAFMKSGNINLINDVMKTLHGCGFKIDQDLFEMAISRYLGKPDKKELLLQLLQWMPSQGYAVHSSTRNLLLKNSHLLSRQLLAEILSKHQTMPKALKHK